MTREELRERIALIVAAVVVDECRGHFPNTSIAADRILDLMPEGIEGWAELCDTDTWAFDVGVRPNAESVRARLILDPEPPTNG